MEKPEPQEKPRGSWLSIILAASLAIVVSTALVVITFFIFGAVLAVAAGIFGFAALHYVAWGWWLPRMIRDEDQADHEADERRD